MKIHPTFSKMTVVLGSAGLGMAAYLRLARPYQLRWGATGEEVGRPMPGDELLPNPNYIATRAITIEATPEEIWPWLAQMGFHRAGFYAYDLIENLGSKSGIHSAKSILPELQHPKAGDVLPISLASRLTFYAIEPNRYLIWIGDPSHGGYIYTWALYPLDENRTRLVNRARFNYSWSNPKQLPFDVLTEFSEHLAIPKILQGVKGRVEGNIEPTWRANFEIAIYLGSLLIYLGAIVMTLLRPLTWRRGLAVFAAGAAWLVNWYAPFAIWIKALLELPVLRWLREAFRQDPAGRLR